MSSSMRVLLGTSVGPHQLTHEGRTYEFRALKEGLKADYETWLIERARDTICRLYPEGETRDRELRRLEREAVSGLYDFHGEIAEESRKHAAGVLKLASLIVGCAVDELVPLYYARKQEVTHLIRLVIAEASGRSPANEVGDQEGQSDPNSRRPDQE